VQTLTDKLAESLNESVKTNTEVKTIEKTFDGKWLVKSDFDENIFDALIISTPAARVANLIENLDIDLNAKLKAIYYPPMAMVFFGIKKENVQRKLDGFGFLVPSSERRKILGTIWNSAVFENRAPDGYHLLTTFVGGARSPELFEESDEELYKIVFEELKSLLDLHAEPNFLHIKRWHQAIPQYNLGYEKVERGIEDFENRNQGIFFCSNFYKGISVGDCVKNAYATADRIEEFFRRN
jgi:oxygen-dependent protoporphyrinogen oxidase